MPTEVDAVIVNVLVGMVLGVPGLIALSLLIAGFRRSPERKSTRPSLFRMFNGALLLGLYGLLLANKFQNGSAVAPLMMILLLLIGLIYQLGQLTQGQTIVASAPVARRSSSQLAPQLVGLRRRDDGFSRVVFFDFVQALYHAAHVGVGTAAHRQLGVYIADDVLNALARELAGARISDVVIGAMNLDEVQVTAEKDALVVDIEANYTKQLGDGTRERYVARERWRFDRPRGTVSAPPDRMRALGCPRCGAPLSVSELGACTHCGAPIKAEKLCWRLSRRVVVALEVFSTAGLGESVPEEGTDLPTIVDPSLAKEAQALAEANGDANPEAFLQGFRQRTLEPSFKQMYAAWSEKRWNAVRHLLTDFLWEAQQHWIRAYMEKKLTNKLDDLQLGDVKLARVERDKYYDAVTVRVFAQCRDFTVDADGKVIGGDPKRVRRFSEYWTFVRSASHEPQPTGEGVDARKPACPNCGAPIDRMGATGICGYCETKITTGNFGWVLATITQDEIYA